MILSAQCKVAPNIAIIKYWGKAHENLIIPLFNSVSLSLDCEDLCSATQVQLLPRELGVPEVSLLLNGQNYPVNTRIESICA